jgi:hypothetical protein
VRLGATKADVLAAWGRVHGVCRRCRRTTWYFNYQPFAPEGVAVEFRAGRAAALFTLWSPSGWSTPKGLRLGDPAARIAELYGVLAERHCNGYTAFRLARRGAVSSVYVDNEKVWGFGLNRPGVAVCR